MPTYPGVYPDYMAPIVRHAPDGVRELCTARWGMPSSLAALMDATKKRATKLEAKGKPVDFKELLRMEPDTARLHGLPWHFLNFFPEPQGHGSFTPTLGPLRRLEVGGRRIGNRGISHCGGGGMTRN